MSYTYLLEQGAESSAASFSDIPASVLSRLNLTAAKSCCKDNAMASCPSSPSGTTCEPSTENRGEDSLMSSAEDFPVRTSAHPERESESAESEVDYGVNTLVSLARFDRATHSLKTRQTLLFEGSTECFLILPKWGWMHDGECFLLAPLVLHTCERECSFWPTPRASDRDNCGGSNARAKAMRDGTYIGRKQNPILQEWLMGWPTGWSALHAVETAKFQQWLNSHGKR